MGSTRLVSETLKTQLHGLQNLLEYLEERSSLETKDYVYCQARLQATRKALKALERVMGRQGR